MLKKLLILMAWLIPFTAIALDQKERLAGSIVLCNTDSLHPLVINSNSGWVDVKYIHEKDFSSIPPPLPETIRKWRVKVSYVDESSQIDQSTLQIRLGQFQNSYEFSPFPGQKRLPAGRKKIATGLPSTTKTK